MFRNYIKIAFRNLWKERTFTALNVIGLTAAFGIAFLLCTYVVYELSFDQFHENKESLFQVYTNEETPQGSESSTTNPVPFAAAMQEEVPGVKYITRLKTGGPSITVGENVYRVGATWADPDYFKMFTFPIALGNSENPLANRSNAVLSDEAANRIFGDTNPIGQYLQVPGNGANKPVLVTAVLEPYPSASSFKPDVIFNFKNLPEEWYQNLEDNWSHHNHDVYVQLEEGIDPATFEASTNTFSKLHYAQDIADAQRDGAQANAQGNYRQIKLLPITDLSVVSIKNKMITVSRTMQFIILGVALLILFIASVNYINMSIAKGAQRLREIGMRKTLGARKGQLFIQFWGESVLVFFISIILGGTMAFGLLKPFQNVFSTKASFQDVVSIPMLLGLLLSLLLVTFIAGGYPAYVMSKLRTLQALQGKLATHGQSKLRNVLMVLQFSIAIVLISGTLVLWEQLDFMRTKDLGFNKEQVLTFPISSSKGKEEVMQLLRNELKKEPSIISVSASDNSLGRGRDHSSGTSVMGFEHQGREVTTNLLFVDYDYPETLDLELIAGRTIERSRAGDSTSIVINEAMARQFTEEDPLNISIDLDNGQIFNVVGMVKDFNFQDMTRNIEPITLFKSYDDRLRYAYIKVRPEQLAHSYDIVANVWKKIEPDREFLGSFLDENIERTLRKERLMTTMISSGSILAIILSCIGLFAMSLLVVAQRRKEIGIRKVVGASVSTITVLLTKDFLKLVAVAFVIATPIAWWASTQWLQSYSYRIDLSFWTFAIAGGMALVIAAVTIGTRTISAALANPVESLKTE